MSVFHLVFHHSSVTKNKHFLEVGTTPQQYLLVGRKMIVTDVFLT